MISVVGFSFAGSGQNAALGFVSLKHWNERSGPSIRAGAGGAVHRRHSARSATR